MQGDHDVGTTTHPKTDVVVAVVGMGAVEAGGRAQVLRIFVPRTAAQHARHFQAAPRALEPALALCRSPAFKFLGAATRRHSVRRASESAFNGARGLRADGGTTTHPKTDELEGDGMEVVAVGRAQELRIVDPRTAAQHARSIFI